MTHYLTDPIKLQFELSSMCNALCLGCVRIDYETFNNKKHMIPDKEYITFDLFKKIVTAPEFNTAIELEFCGTIDDPLMHPEFIEFLDWAGGYAPGRFTVQIHTNASLRNAAYWQRLAQVLTKHKKHYLKFNIDGLEDTNHIYRQNTTWSKIMDNARAFIDAGGRAYWQYLIFPWNEHQVDQAQTLSVDMGFRGFTARHDRSIATEWGLERIHFLKKENKNKNTSLTLAELNDKTRHIIDNEIRCNNMYKKMYFITYDGRLWPCCFLHNGTFNLNKDKVDILNKRLYGAYQDYDWNNMYKYDIGQILSHKFYTNDLVTSWESKEHGYGQTDRIHRCTEICNVKKLEKLPIGEHTTWYTWKEWKPGDDD